MTCLGLARPFKIGLYYCDIALVGNLAAIVTSLQSITIKIYKMKGRERALSSKIKQSFSAVL